MLSLGVKGHLRRDAVEACVSAGHLGCVRLALVTLVVAFGEDSLMMLAEIYYIITAPSALPFLSVLLTRTNTLLGAPVAPFSEICTPLPFDPAYALK